MFTGIVEAVAEVTTNGSNALAVARPVQFDDVRIGSSIAVNGVCLSVTSFDENNLQFDVIEETLRRTTLGSLRGHDKVNLERALSATGRFDGHIVQGHVEGTGKIIENAKWKMENEKEKKLMVELPTQLLPFVVEKGSVTIDGVSLTVVEIDGNECSVALIPHTIKNTTLGMLSAGDRVNIETDILAKYLLQKK